jgi:cyclopropane-fatty-acyl-phospholipid synthase
VAALKDIEFSYDDLDGYLGRALGTEFPDFTGALYGGDFTLSLTEAQRRKREYVLDSIGCQAGKRILDIGCGWGNMLNAVRERGATGVGVTLSPAQAARCGKNGLDVRLQDWKEMKRAESGGFDGIVSLGAFEHFCSMEEFVAGRQEEIYSRFFALCSDLLPKGGRLFLQTMTWGNNLPWGKQFPKTLADYQPYLDPKAPLRSDERSLYLIVSFFPGSWLPTGKEQLVDLAGSHFQLKSELNGRLDYIQTVRKWEEALLKNKTRSLPHTVKFISRYVFGGAKGRAWVNFINESAMMHVFAGQVFDHYRLVFEKN